MASVSGRRNKSSSSTIIVYLFAARCATIRSLENLQKIRNAFIRAESAAFYQNAGAGVRWFFIEIVDFVSESNQLAVEVTYWSVGGHEVIINLVFRMIEHHLVEKSNVNYCTK